MDNYKIGNVNFLFVNERHCKDWHYIPLEISICMFSGNSFNFDFFIEIIHNFATCSSAVIVKVSKCTKILSF